MPRPHKGAKLRISQIKCYNLPDKDAFSIKKFFGGDLKDKLFDRKVDPYVTFKLDGAEDVLRTKTITDENNPEWITEIVLFLGRPVQFNDNLLIVVYDDENFGSDINIGEARASLEGLARNVKEQQPSKRFKYNLYLNNRSTEAQIEFRIDYIGEDEEVVDGGRRTQDGQVLDKTISEHHSRKNRYPDKEVDFKIYVKIHEACQFVHSCGNLKVIITIGGVSYSTKVQLATTKVKYNEEFWFHFKCKPSELFEKVICFELYDIPDITSKLINHQDENITQSTTMLGFFKHHVSFLYHQDAERLLRKWLVLSEPDDTYRLHEVDEMSIPTAVAGYLKVTAALLGPRDNVSKAIDKPKITIHENTRSNVYNFRDVALKKMLSVRIYHAEDLPQMDLTSFRSNDKSKIDAYVKVSFNGIQHKTKVNSSYRPIFNQEILFTFNFPSVCDVLKLELWDKDPTVDDYIGTTEIKLSNLFKPTEDGFLPLFGPAYKNFYGSAREFTVISDDEQMNCGKVEGMAYRGRLFLEIEQKDYNEADSYAIRELDKKEISHLDIYKKKTKYVLNVTFLSAAMLDEFDHSVRFEVSIGTYGNKLDELVEPQSSCTPAMNPIYDGCKHYFIPWNENKPCCIVESLWEDVEYRMKFINYVQFAVDKFENGTKSIHDAGIFDNTSFQHVSNLLRELHKDFTDLERFLQDHDEEEAHLTQHTVEKRKTNLDNKLHRYRMSVIQRLSKELLALENKVILLVSSDEQDNDLRNKLVAANPIFMKKLRLAIDDLCNEEQDHIPDVIISMIVGEKRKAYCRIPARKILFANNYKLNGLYCQKFQNLIMKYPTDSSKKYDVPCCISFIAYLGKSSYHKFDYTKDKACSTYAEVYEKIYGLESLSYTQITDTANKVIEYSCKSLIKSSDWQKKIEKKNILSYNWEWGKNSEWVKVPFESCDDIGIIPRVTLDEIFETQSRLPFNDWINVYYTNSFGDIIEDFDKKRHPPDGYQWATEWLPDTPVPANCDDGGWQYAIDLRSATWSSDCLFIHRCRRKRLTRKRELKDQVDITITKLRKKKMEDEDYWMYSTAFHDKFHMEKKIFDTVKRRKLQRRIRLKEKGKKSRVLSRDESFAVVGEEVMGSVLKKKSPKLFGRGEAIPEDAEKDETGHKKEKKKEKLKQEEEEEKEEEGEEERSQEKGKHCYQLLPTVYKHVKASKWQLRICLWQGCNLKSSDISGLSDPYVVGTFLQYSAQTRVLEQTLNPIWDETLYFEEIRLYGEPEIYKNSSPDVILDLWDHDNTGKHEFLGRCLFKPIVILDYDAYSTEKTRLVWYPIFYKGKQHGQVLATAQLIHLNDELKESLVEPPLYSDLLDVVKQKKDGYHTDLSKYYQLPHDMRPKEEQVYFEFFYFGVRSITNKSELTRVKSPSVELVIGGNTIKGSDIYEINQLNKEKKTKTPLTLASDPYYLPPVTLNVYQHRYGIKSLIGTHILKDFQIKVTENDNEKQDIDYPNRTSKPGIYPVPDPRVGFSYGGKSADVSIDFADEYDNASEKDKLRKTRKEEVHLDWWCKYHATKGELDKANGYLDKRHDIMEWYKDELENVDEFKKMTVYYKFQLLGEEGQNTGELKGLINCIKADVIPESTVSTNLSDRQKTSESLLQKLKDDYIVRVYIIRGINLKPSDLNGKADGYVTVQLGKEKQSSKENYVKNELNPFFGQYFQLNMSSEAKDLKIKVKDYDRLDRNDLIGETVIDLENRLLWNYKLGVGLPKKFYKDGPFKWRDTYSPVTLLKKAVKQKFNKSGEFTADDTEFVVHGKFSRSLLDYQPNSYVPVTYETRSKKKRLALHILNDESIELITPYIKEHIETRTLKNDLYPDEPQGQLEMFVEMFPKREGIPGPFLNIIPRKPRDYFLRVIVYRTAKVELQEKEILSGKDMSDIYVKGWFKKEKKKQSTDIHYRSMDGEGLFNWRMVFPFKYIPEEKKIVFEKKDHFWEIESTEKYEKPILRIECWDSDTFSLDDYLGYLELNLSRLLRPQKSYKDCKLPDVDPKMTHKNLAEQEEKSKKRKSEQDQKKKEEIAKRKSKDFKKLHTNGMVQSSEGYELLPSAGLSQEEEEERILLEEERNRKEEEEKYYVDLFSGAGKQKGWWLLTDEKGTKDTGKIELELEVITAEENEVRPAGLGRSEPNMNPRLEEPDRPKTSFFWLTSPWKSFKFILWRHNKWKIIFAILMLLLTSLVIVWIYNMPEYALEAGIKGSKS